MITQCIDPRAVVPGFLPSVALRAIADLPDYSGIYIVLSRHKILYIGQAKSLRDRWVNGHHKAVQIFEYPDIRIAYICCPVDYLEYSEKLFIAHFDPPLNTAAGKRKKALWKGALDALGVDKRMFDDSPPTIPMRPRQMRSEKDFEEFWSACQKKINKHNARRHFDNAVKGEDLTLIIAALEKQQRWHMAKNGHLNYLSQPAFWLVNRRWEDDPALFELPQDTEEVAS